MFIRFGSSLTVIVYRQSSTQIKFPFARPSPSLSQDWHPALAGVARWVGSGEL